MEAAMDEKQLKAPAAELAKHVKTEKDLGNLSATVTDLPSQSQNLADLTHGQPRLSHRRSPSCQRNRR